MKLIPESLVLTMVFLLVACANTPAPALSATANDPPQETSKLQGVTDALDELAHNSIIMLARADSLATIKWADGPDGPKDPMYLAKAKACPTAIILASDNLVQQTGVLKAILLNKVGSDDDPKTKGIILPLTKKRYGPSTPGTDLREVFVMVRHDVFERITFVRDSCREIIPAKEINHVLELAGRAGIIGGTGGIGSLLP